MRILLAEDDVELAARVATALGAAGFAVDRAEDGADAEFRGQTEAYDAVVLDLGLPNLDGVSVLHRWREAGLTLPVLVLTARSRWHDKLAGFNAGADDYLTKPFSFVVLLARLRSLLRRSPAPRPVVASAAGVSLDPSTREVTCDGAPVELSARETSLLEHLIRAHPRPVSKERLLDDIWAGASADPNVVEAFVGHLRRKIGRERIVTVRGLGYRLAQQDSPDAG